MSKNWWTVQKIVTFPRVPSLELWPIFSDHWLMLNCCGSADQLWKMCCPLVGEMIDWFSLTHLKFLFIDKYGAKLWFLAVTWSHEFLKNLDNWAPQVLKWYCHALHPMYFGAKHNFQVLMRRREWEKWLDSQVIFQFVSKRFCLHPWPVMTFCLHQFLRFLHFKKSDFSKEWLNVNSQLSRYG